MRSFVSRNLGLVLITCLCVFRVKLFSVHLLRFVLCSSLWLLLSVCSEGGGLPQDNTARADRLLSLAKTAILAVQTPKTPL